MKQQIYQFTTLAFLWIGALLIFSSAQLLAPPDNFQAIRDQLLPTGDVMRLFGGLGSIVIGALMAIHQKKLFP